MTSSAGFTATVNWGDGTSSQGQISGGYDGIPWLFEIDAQHAYPNPSNGEYSIEVTLTDPDGGKWYASPSIATVDPRPDDLSAAPVGTDTFSVANGQPLAGAVAIVTIPDPNLSVTGLTGEITNVTDGTTTPATIVPDGSGGWDVYDSEDFTDPGPNEITVTIEDKQGDSTTLNGHVDVAVPANGGKSGSSGGGGTTAPGRTLRFLR